MSSEYAERKSDALAQLFEAIQAAIDFGENLRFDAEDLNHRLLICQFLAMTELADSIHILMTYDKVFDAEILLRSLMEARVKIELFVQDNEYGIREELELLKVSKKKLDIVLNGNKYFGQIANLIDAEAERDALTAKIASVVERGIKGQIPFEQMCRKVGFADEYEAIYRGLSQAPHGTYGSLIKRNISIDHETETFSLTAFRLPEIETVDVVGSQAIDWLKESQRILEAYLKNSHISQV